MVRPRLALALGDRQAGPSNHSQRRRRAKQVLEIQTGLGIGETPFRLCLIDSENNEVCSIEGLTNGEARWMRQMIERKRANWFQ
jgi:hypothetical protein